MVCASLLLASGLLCAWFNLLFTISALMHQWTLITGIRYYLRQGGNVFAGLCLSVCVCTR